MGSPALDQGLAVRQVSTPAGTSQQRCILRLTASMLLAMSIPFHKQLAIVLGVLCAVLFVGSGFLFWNYGWLHIQAAFADDQTEIFDEMRTKALQSTSPADIAGMLQYAVFYYPSGTKQEAGSQLDRVVERHRTVIVSDIIAHLRPTTGQDLGENPEPWIQKYGQR